ncbi:ThiF family adenylyltransferase [Frankia sp. AgW1.1]|uniref:ThiF family adenylyltransferase n=1 Tax=unclassified Frankia TaxID=2632575 RepID=UPI001A379251|nr:ThiF family adenylyltransferase [Frankia sp. AgW1.1]MBL7618835.1 ThiF family adenylyltransferase [Frankia sp. AgB1.8]
MFGPESQRRLDELTVAVVGVGGAGSLIVQGLAHVGVGRLVLVDPDVVDETSLARLVGARPQDARRGTAKVDVARRTARAVNPGLKVRTIRRAGGRRVAGVATRRRADRRGRRARAALGAQPARGPVRPALPRHRRRPDPAGNGRGQGCNRRRWPGRGGPAGRPVPALPGRLRPRARRA